jgi:hypothetical protein
MIDPLTEHLIRPTEATKLYPRGPNGKKVHVSKVYRDMQYGHDGVVLESVQTPTLATSREAVARFFRQLTEARTRRQSRPTGRIRPVVDRTNRDVEQELDRLGI